MMAPFSELKAELLDQIELAEDLTDTSWLEVLDDDDEPPLLRWFDQVEVLRARPLDDWGVLLLGLAIEALVATAAWVCTRGRPSREYFCYVTVQDYADALVGEVPVPRVALYVDPLFGQRGYVRDPLVEPWSDAGLAVQDWLGRVDDPDGRKFVVGEARLPGHGDLHRVYVGFREKQCDALRSVAEDLRE